VVLRCRVPTLPLHPLHCSAAQPPTFMKLSHRCRYNSS
jgi:hypothetical protein